MSSVISAIRNTVPISLFNRGLAGKIFGDVKKGGPRVVMKNNVAEAVILSPDEYVQMMDDLNDYLLLTMAMERSASFDESQLVAIEDVERSAGITQDDLDSVGEIEFE